MEEEVTQKTIALAIKTTKLTTHVLRVALQKYLAAQKHKGSNPYKRGKQSYKQLKRQGAGLSHIEITDDNIKAFEKVAREYRIDFCVKLAEKGVPPTYYVFFKGTDTDTMNLAFKRFVSQKVQKQNKPSIMEKLEHFKEVLAKGMNRERTRENQKERGPSL